MRTQPKTLLALSLTITTALCLSSCVSMVKYRGLEQSVSQLQNRPQYDPTDTDGDGVPDITDYEKNSPPGARVDTRGIVLDSDLDGIPDYKDREPYSAPSVRVDQNGVTVRTDASGRPIPNSSNPNPPANPVDDRATGGYNTPPPAAAQYLSTTVNFGIYSTLLSVQEQRKIDEVAATLSQTPGAKLDILGFADDYRVSSDNIKLALQRAEAVKQALVDRGIVASTLSTGTAVPTREDAGRYQVKFKMSGAGMSSTPGASNLPGDEASPIFPTPYPQPSSMGLMAANMLPKGNSLFDLSSQMTDALRRAGYDRIWYFNLPQGYNGFALITQIESINDDATPSAPRFEQAVSANMATLGELEKYFFNLIKARRGLFRYVVLLVSDRTPSPDSGFDDPSNAIQDPKPASGNPNDMSRYNLQALVYEFYKEQYNSNPVFTKERQPAALHMERSGIAPQLRKAAASSSTVNPPAPGSGSPSTPTTQPGTVSGKYYVVQKGDTVYSLSRRFRLTEAQLRKLNGMADNAIQIGQQLRIAE